MSGSGWEVVVVGAVFRPYRRRRGRHGERQLAGAMDLTTLTASAAAPLLASREIRSTALVRACLAQVAAREPVLKAWAFIDPDLALRQAAARDDTAAPVGPLHGIPIGVKDVIDTADMPTQMGSPIYAGHRPPTDAACVALLRAAGAVILGKTVTAEFAGVAPGPTTNPHNPGHTPGGSSSGSAAAVAAGMVTAALGTQTGGSVLRPAAFCGIVGYKPSFGLINRAGLKFAAESIDTIGVLTRSVADAALVGGVLAGGAIAQAASNTPPRLGFCRTPHWDCAAPETVAALDDARQRLVAAGANVTEFVLPDRFARLWDVRDIINNFERARALASEWATHWAQLSPQMTRSITDGLAIPLSRYLEATAFVERCRQEFPAAMQGFDAILTPSANGEAPETLASTGAPLFQSAWTLLHAPAISLPTHRGPRNLPIGIQLVAPRHADGALLGAARWVEAALGTIQEHHA